MVLGRESLTACRAEDGLIIRGVDKGVVVVRTLVRVTAEGVGSRVGLRLRIGVWV
jgi:hypothetical protein